MSAALANVLSMRKARLAIGLGLRRNLPSSARRQAKTLGCDQNDGRVIGTKPVVPGWGMKKAAIAAALCGISSAVCCSSPDSAPGA